MLISTKNKTMEAVSIMKKILIAIILMSINLVSTPAAELLFSSGFESAITLTKLPKGFAYWNLTGTDVGTGDDWTTTINAIPETRIAVDGGLYGNYDSTWITHSLAELVADPKDAENQVMHFTLPDAPWNVRGWYDSARLSAAMMYNLSGDDVFKEGYIKYRMYLDAGFSELEDLATAIDWLVITEIFEHAYENCQRFRCNLNIHKDAGVGESLYWELTAQDYSSCNTMGAGVWTETNTSVSIPVETWFTFEMYFKKGNASTGRVWVAITPDGGSQQVLFDVTNHTQNSGTSSFYTGDWAVFKLYIDGAIVHSMADNKTPLGSYYDDFEYWDDIPEIISIPAPPENVIIID